MKKLKQIFCLIGNYLPPKLNCYFYKLAGVKFNPSKVWIGNKCYLDTMFPENITIQDNVCISFGVTIVCHFDPTKGIKDHPVNKYKKRVLLEEGVFVGPKSILMPGIIIKKNTFVQAGTVVSKTTTENSIICGNPQREKKYLKKNLVSKLNYHNKNYNF